MRSLSAAVLEQVLTQVASWRLGGLTVPVSVNVSLHDLSDASFATQVTDGLRRHGLPPSALTLEITEQALVGDPTRALQTLDALRAGGIELSLDDFGTGHASLTRLKRLPVAELKIERQFVQHLDTRHEDVAIVRSVVELARGLGLRCIAEGVETEAVLARLHAFGCDVAQGYHIARPMPAGDVVPWVAGRPPAPPPGACDDAPPAAIAASAPGA
jgi:diguanylate cyclase